MSDDLAATLATILSTVVVPLVVRALVHRFPWLADASTNDRRPDTSGDVSGRQGDAEGG